MFAAFAAVEVAGAAGIIHWLNNIAAPLALESVALIAVLSKFRKYNLTVALVTALAPVSIAVMLSEASDEIKEGSIIK